MLIVERQEKLLSHLRACKAATLDALVAELNVSPSTVRRDLEALETRKQVRRTHGGAIYLGDKREAYAFERRKNEQVEEKKTIGRMVASMVEPHMTLIVGGGSTTLFALEKITARPLHIITHSLSIAQQLADDDQVEVILIGGRMIPHLGVLVGPVAEQTLTTLNADLMLFSAAGCDTQYAYNRNMEQANLERAMIDRSAKRILLMDSSKFGRRSLTSICAIDQIDMVITDENIKPEWPEKFGNNLIVADSHTLQDSENTD